MIKVLFIGNSFTYYNDLPAMTAELSAKAGTEILAESVTKGGWFLRKFADPEDEMGQELRRVYPREEWDYIVLQEQSLCPAANPEEFLASVEALRAFLKPRKKFLMYQTWAYEDGSEKLKNTGMEYGAMRDGLKAAYEEAARRTGAACVPVGSAFSLCRDRYPAIVLYREDHFHPSPEGTYLAACLFVHELTGIRPEALSSPEGLEEGTAACLRLIAGEIAGSRAGTGTVS